MLEVDESGDVITVAFAHGKVNALDVELLQEIAQQFRSRAGDQRAIVLTGRGSVFSAGVDLRRIVDGGPEYVDEFLPALSEAFLAVFEHPQPVVAAVNGHALAGGTVFAAACDLRLASAGSATLGVTELKVGVAFPTAALEIMRHAVGDANASRLILTGDRIDVDEAYRLGLIHEIVDGDVLAAATDRAAELGRMRPKAYTISKVQLRRDALQRISQHRDDDAVEVNAVWAAPDTHDAIADYLSALAGRRSS